MRKKYLIALILLIAFSSLTFSSASADDVQSSIIKRSTDNSSEDLSNVQKTKTILVGTTNYIPYSYKDENGQITGLDIELLKEIAKRNNWNIDFNVFAFSGLFDALDLGQIDIAVGGISVTDERKQKMDFTNIYFASEDVVYANKSLDKNNLTKPEDFAGLHVGVERGTTHDDWATYNLVKTGIISDDRLIRYSDLANGVDDLASNHIDVLILDLESADSWLNKNSFKEVGRGFEKEYYAFALKKGSSLTAAINSTLGEMGKDGTAQKIADEFFSVKKAAPMNVSATLQPSDSLTTESDALTQSCINGMAFVKDITYPDYNMTQHPQVMANQWFTKTWRVINTGTCTWTPEYTLVYYTGPHMDGDKKAVKVPMNVEPGKEIDLSIRLLAPDKGGVYRLYFNMLGPKKHVFGQELYLNVQVIH